MAALARPVRMEASSLRKSSTAFSMRDLAVAKASLVVAMLVMSFVSSVRVMSIQKTASSEQITGTKRLLECSSQSAAMTADALIGAVPLQAVLILRQGEEEFQPGVGGSGKWRE